MTHPHTYFDRDFQKSTQRVLPGEFAVAKVAANQGLLMTVLGSCVSVCLLDVPNAVTGMNHFMLPEYGVLSVSQTDTELNAASLNARYGSQAMELLINRMLDFGASRKSLQAYVFGGASVLKSFANIGKENVDFALAYLARERIRVISHDVGGTAPRRIYIDLETGQPNALALSNASANANAKLIPSLVNEVGTSESLYARRLLAAIKQPRASVSLFE
jgi:chemotaxis protein CheD